MIFTDITMSLDGFVAGPNPTQEEPLGAGGEQLHEWAFTALAWREQHGLEGGEANADSEWIADTVANVGAGIMGRRMYSGGAGPWDGDPNPRGWWGDEPPFHHPVFVLTHHAREPLELEGTTFHFVTGGIGEALERAREAAQRKDVQVHGGGSAVQQALAAGALDVLQVHIAPVLLGAGSPLFAGTPGKLRRTRLVESPTGAVHLRYER